MISAVVMNLDEQIFRAHVAEGPFQSGVDIKKWELVSIDWPHVVISVSATPHKEWPSVYYFRFECTNYPNSAVTGQPWDVKQNAPLEKAKWPGGKNRVPKVFNPDWNNGQCLYLPCDRIADQWTHRLAAEAFSPVWGPDRDITLYLGAIHELLNSSDYTGPGRA